MAYEPKPGQFSLFKNERKEKDSHPDYKGDGMSLDGKPIWVSAWLKRTERGTFMSCSITLKEAKQDRPKQATSAGFVDDDVPFANPYRGRRSLVV
jgi:hypothetical protein